MDTADSAENSFVTEMTLTSPTVENNSDNIPKKVAQVTFDPEGDVILVPASHITSRFLICAKVLCLASPVFQAMLGRHSHFKEGIALANSPSIPVEVVLYDDDPKALFIILRILHFQHHLVPRKLEEDTLYQMAILCDKYDMQPVLGSWFNDRVSQITVEAPDSLTGTRWLSMACAFGHRTLFTKLSKEIILRWRVLPSGGRLAYIKQSFETSFDKFVPQQVVDAIIGARKEALESLFACVNRLLLSYVNGKQHCSYGSELCDVVTLGLISKGLAKMGILLTGPDSTVQSQSVTYVGQLLSGLSLPQFEISEKKTLNDSSCCCNPVLQVCIVDAACKNKCAQFKKKLKVPNTANHYPQCSPLPLFKADLTKAVENVQGLELSEFSSGRGIVNVPATEDSLAY